MLIKERRELFVGTFLLNKMLQEDPVLPNNTHLGGKRFRLNKKTISFTVTVILQNVFFSVQKCSDK